MYNVDWVWVAEKGRWGTMLIIAGAHSKLIRQRDSLEGLTICDCLSTPEPAAREVRICSLCVIWITSGISCCEKTSVCCRQEMARTFVSSPLVSGSSRNVS